jgi:hypothetical protein
LQKIVERENGEMELLVMNGRGEYRQLLVHDRAMRKRARVAVIEGHSQRCVRFKPAPREAESDRGSSGQLGSRRRSRQRSLDWAEARSIRVGHGSTSPQQATSPEKQSAVNSSQQPKGTVNSGKPNRVHRTALQAGLSTEGSANRKGPGSSAAQKQDLGAFHSHSHSHSQK